MIFLVVKSEGRPVVMNKWPILKRVISYPNTLTFFREFSIVYVDMVVMEIISLVIQYFLLYSHSCFALVEIDKKNHVSFV